MLSLGLSFLTGENGGEGDNPLLECVTSSERIKIKTQWHLQKNTQFIPHRMSDKSRIRGELHKFLYIYFIMTMLLIGMSLMKVEFVLTVTLVKMITICSDRWVTCCI